MNRLLIATVLSSLALGSYAYADEHPVPIPHAACMIGDLPASSAKALTLALEEAKTMDNVRTVIPLFHEGCTLTVQRLKGGPIQIQMAAGGSCGGCGQGHGKDAGFGGGGGYVGGAIGGGGWSGGGQPYGANGGYNSNAGRYGTGNGTNAGNPGDTGDNGPAMN